MSIDLPQDVIKILNILNEHNYSSYVVGGCVRDSIMGIEPKDWDITTDATPQQVSDIFEFEDMYQVIPTGEKYGTLTIRVNNDNYEITTFRFDGEYSDGRRPDKVTFGKSILDDLSRRDLTINAIAYNQLVGLVDPFDGVNDIKNHNIKFVGEAEKRIKEDSLRILRAIRFLTKYRLNIDSTTVNILNNNSILLNNVSKERIHDELIQILKYINNNSFKKVINDLGEVFGYIFEKPILKWSYNEWLDPLFSNKNYLYKISRIYLSDPLYKTEIWLRKYKFTNKEIKKVLTYINIQRYLDEHPIDKWKNKDIEVRKMISKFGNDLIDLYMFFDGNKEIENLLIDKNCSYPTRLTDLMITGDDLLQLGYQGVEIGNILDKLLEEVILNPKLNNKEDLYFIINKYNKEQEDN